MIKIRVNETYIPMRRPVAEHMCVTDIWGFFQITGQCRRCNPYAYVLRNDIVPRLDKIRNVILYFFFRIAQHPS